mgnify:CR=1 FL=1
MILLARYVVPVDRPPLPEGGVRIEGGRLTQVGPKTDLRGEPAIDLGPVALFPGLINAHAHLELSAYAGALSPASLWTWMPRLVVLRRKGTPEAERRSAARAAAESLHAGVTCIADISRRGDAWSALRTVPVRKVCFAELISTAADPPRDPAELARAVEAVECDDRLSVGVSPHAPYTVRPRDFVGAVEFARRRGLPLTTHWAETEQERRWLERGGGLLGAVVRGFSRGDPICSPRCSPMRYAERLGLLSAGALLAHVNYIDDDDLGRLRRSSASVVYCPRSHRFFRHKPHRWRDMLAAGINVCVGTDSAASLPPGATLSVWEELRFLHREHPDVPTETLLSMATIRSARALGLADKLGSITPGKAADLVAMPLNDPLGPDPIADVLEGSMVPVGVWVAGERYPPPAPP